MGIRAKLFAAFFAIICFGSIPLRAENPVKEKQDRFSLAVECIKRFEGWHGEKRHWPYVGYGHKVLPGERLTNGITKEQGGFNPESGFTQVVPYVQLSGT